MDQCCSWWPKIERYIVYMTLEEILPLCYLSHSRSMWTLTIENSNWTNSVNLMKIKIWYNNLVKPIAYYVRIKKLLPTNQIVHAFCNRFIRPKQPNIPANYFVKQAIKRHDQEEPIYGNSRGILIDKRPTNVIYALRIRCHWFWNFA